MQRIALHTSRTLVLLIAGILASGPALADKPSWAGKNDQGDRHDSQRESDHDKLVPRGKHFDERQRTVVHDYYDEQFQRGHCPPGLAKKHNGCMPPGQAKQWIIGQQLPEGVAYYRLPSALAAQIGQPPAGQRYVRVADDILLITPATRLVLDVLQNLGRS